MTRLLDCVLVEQGDGPLLDDTAAARVRRALLHGQSFSSIDVPPELDAGKSALISAGEALERCGFVIERKPRAVHGQGRAPVDYRVLNLEHVPTSDLPPSKSRKSRKSKGDTPRRSSQGTVRDMLLSGRAVSIEALRFEGFDIKTRDHFLKIVSNARRSYDLKTSKLPDGSYVLEGLKAPKTSAKSTAAVHVPASVPPPTEYDASALPSFGGSLRVVGLQLGDDDSVRVALRNGVGTWVVSIEGYYVKEPVDTPNGR